MLKLVYVIRRRAGLRPEEFRAWWLDRHAPLVTELAGAIGALRYVQSHPYDHPASEAMRSARGMLPPADGVASLWWESRAAFEAAQASPEGREAARRLAEDEARFIDVAGSQAFLTVEHEIFDHRSLHPVGGGALKVTYCLAGRSDLSRAEVHRTWLHDHGPLVAGFAGPLRMARYVQSHAAEPDLNDGLRAARGLLSPLDGLTEVWFSGVADLERSGETDAQRAAARRLVEDERRFVAMERSRCFLTREIPIFDRTP